jgi:polar amino acid transport system substrate-binding protein
MTLRWGRRNWLCCAVLLGLSSGHGNACAAEPVRISTSELAPYATERHPGEPGALHEMVAELVRRTGVTSTIEFVPWRRALFLTSSRPRSAVFPLTRSPEREAQYRWLAPLYHENFVFLSLKKNPNFNSASPERNKGRRIGALRGSLMIGYLHQLGYPNVVEAASVEEGMRFLRRGIVDALCNDREILRSLLGGNIHSDFAVSPTLRAATTWLGGSLDFSDAEAQRFEQAMKGMIEDGTYGRILKKYQLGQPQ